MYSQLLISSDDGMQKLWKGMDNWYDNNHSMQMIFFKKLNSDQNQLKTYLVPDKDSYS